MGLLGYLSRISICKKKKGKHQAAASSFETWNRGGGNWRARKRGHSTGGKACLRKSALTEGTDAYLHGRCGLQTKGANTAYITDFLPQCWLSALS